jgi:flavin reductase (DIM6/NTAB) family NADH-FMN oxidoreductase RutF
LFATGVAVIVAHADGEVPAKTPNAVSSLSLDPMLVMFCPGKKFKLARHVTRRTGFTINILRQEREALSAYFSTRSAMPSSPVAFDSLTRAATTAKRAP